MDYVAIVSSLAGAALTGGGLFYAARQLKLATQAHSTAEAWKRVEFARSLIDRLSSDDELAFCTRALDWGTGYLIIPEKHRALFPEGMRKMKHDLDIMHQALRPFLQVSPENAEAMTYRYSFDAFFTLLSIIVCYIRLGLLTRDQLVGVRYYLKLVQSSPYRRGREGESDFKPFLEKHHKILAEFIWSDESGLRDQADGLV